MKEIRPILIWRIQDMPSEVERTLIEDGFHGNKGGYRKWLLSKSGDEFIILVPNEYLYHDREVAEDLGVVSVESAAGGGEPTYTDDLFTTCATTKKRETRRATMPS